MADDPMPAAAASFLDATTAWEAWVALCAMPDTGVCRLTELVGASGPHRALAVAMTTGDRLAGLASVGGLDVLVLEAEDHLGAPGSGGPLAGLVVSLAQRIQRGVDDVTPTAAWRAARLAATMWRSPEVDAVLEAAVQLGRWAVATLPVDHAERASAVTAAARALLLRNGSSDQGDDLDQAVILLGEAGSRAPTEAARAGAENDLAAALVRRHQRDGHHADLDRAAALVRAALGRVEAGLRSAALQQNLETVTRRQQLRPGCN